MSRIVSHLKAMFEPRPTDAEPELVDQFYVTLRSTFQQIDEQRLDASPTIRDRVRLLLGESEKSWRNAYEIERLLVAFYDQSSLEVELARRRVEANRVLYDDVATYYANTKDVDDVEEAKALLSRLLNDLQWRYTINEKKQTYTRLLQTRTTYAFVISMVAFFAVLLLPTGIESTTGTQSISTPTLRASALFVAAVSGSLGAAFSLLVGVRRGTIWSFNELKTLHRRMYVFSRISIGFGAGCILLLFLQSELLTGPLFPQLSVANDATVTMETTVTTWSLMVIWCFLAGFSESVVPNLLGQAERNVQIRSE